MLDNGYKPDNFNAWMWTFIKKRYARWCNRKQITLSKFEIDDVFDYTDIASNDCVEDTILYDEDVELLRRELALMAKDYREIVISYYLDNNKIGIISKMTGLPEGTVKHNVNNSSEKYPLGRPWSLMKRLAAKNIALEAYNNPSTIEELKRASQFLTKLRKRSFQNSTTSLMKSTRAKLTIFWRNATILFMMQYLNRYLIGLRITAQSRHRHQYWNLLSAY